MTDDNSGPAHHTSGPALHAQKWVADVRVTLKPVVNDPPGLAIREALHNLGFASVDSVRSGKLIRVSIDAESEEAASHMVDDMCRRLLANPVIEDYTFTISNSQL